MSFELARYRCGSSGPASLLAILRPDVFRFPHADNHRAYRRVRKDVAQSHLRQSLEDGTTVFNFSTRSRVGVKFFGPKYMARQSPLGKFVSSVSFPPRLPSSSGTRAITPTFNSWQRERVRLPAPDQKGMDHLHYVDQASLKGFDPVFRFPTIEAKSE